MVSKKKALIASGLSALAVGIVHFVAHKAVPMLTTNASTQVYIVGGVVVLTVFGIGYFGMRSG